MEIVILNSYRTLIIIVHIILAIMKDNYFLRVLDLKALLVALLVGFGLLPALIVLLVAVPPLPATVRVCDFCPNLAIYKLTPIFCTKYIKLK